MKIRSVFGLGYLLPAMFLLSSCATLSPEARLRAGLMDAGLPPATAGCMAERMADRLSLPQLRRIQSLASLRNSHMEGLTIDLFLHKLRALEDPEIFVVTSKAAIACTLLR